jgi:flagellar biosynthesis regulator FlbT
MTTEEHAFNPEELKKFPVSGIFAAICMIDESTVGKEQAYQDGRTKLIEELNTRETSEIIDFTLEILSMVMNED